MNAPGDAQIIFAKCFSITSPFLFVFLRKVQGKWRGEKIQKAKLRHRSLSLKDAPGKTRTCNLLIRSQMLYPIELRVLYSARSENRGGR